MEVRFDWEKYWCFFIAVPTKNRRWAPKLKYVVKDGIPVEEKIEYEIPNAVLAEMYKRAAVIFNKF